MASAAAATAPVPPVVAEDVAPAKRGKKKLLLIGIAVLVLLALAGGGAAFWLKSKAAHAAAEAGDDDAAASHAGAKPDPAHPPTFLPLDPFVVNLADKDTERYAQIGITLEVDNAAFAEQMKTYMPAIRNSILMILAHKNSHELLERAGKEQLADEIMREAVRPMGIVAAAPASATAPKPIDEANADDEVAAEDEESDAPAAPKKKKTSKAASKAKRAGPDPAVHNPVRHVHFSNFIIQ